MSQWRYEVTKKNCNTFDEPKYIQFTTESVMGNGMNPTVWSDLVSETPTAFIKGEYGFDAKGSTYGNKSYDEDLGVNWFFPAKRLGRMFPRHKKKQQIVYVA